MDFRNFLFSSHLDDGEEILYVAHRHPFVLLKDSYKVSIFGLFLPLMFYYYWPQLFWGTLVWFVVGFVGFLYYLMDWYFDAWLVTNQGIIDIERNGLFDRNSTRVDYHMVEGMAYSISGFWNTILNFGDITIDKLGAKTNLVLTDAARPKKVERTIMRLQEEFVYEKSIKDHDTLKGMLSDMIAYHVQNNKIKTPKR